MYYSFFCYVIVYFGRKKKKRSYKVFSDSIFLFFIFFFFFFFASSFKQLVRNLSNNSFYMTKTNVSISFTFSGICFLSNSF